MTTHRFLCIRISRLFNIPNLARSRSKRVYLSNAVRWSRQPGGLGGFVHPSERLFHLACRHGAARQKAVDTSAVVLMLFARRRARLLRRSVPIRVTIVCITLIENNTRRRVRLRIFSGVVIFSGRNTIRACAAVCFDVINDATACPGKNPFVRYVLRPRRATMDVVHLNTSSTLRLLLPINDEIM